MFIAVNALNTDIVYDNIQSNQVTPEFMQSSFKQMIGLPFRDWVAPDASSVLLAEFKSLVYRLEGVSNEG
jgi:hypothetical protein